MVKCEYRKVVKLEKDTGKIEVETCEHADYGPYGDCRLCEEWWATGFKRVCDGAGGQNHEKV